MEKNNKENRFMVQSQLISRGIKNKKILNAFSKIDRVNFVLDENTKYAYEDSPLPIGYGQTISQPYVVALMLEHLDPDKNDTVADIGSGSGYQAAILSKVSKKVIGYEIIPELCKFAKKNLKKENIENVEIICSDGRKLKDGEFFDKIICAASTDKVPNSWVKSLKEGGLIVLPEGDENLQKISIYKKTEGKIIPIAKSIPVRFVPLVKDK